MSEADKKDTSAFLDEVEKLVVNALVPTVRRMKIAIPTIEGDDEQIARNLIAKVGTRIMFSNSMTKEQIDKILTK